VEIKIRWYFSFQKTNEGLEIESMEEKMTLMKRKMKKTKSNSMKKIILSLLVFQMKR